jgi:polar amino acid transport system substrate-binding protein
MFATHSCRHLSYLSTALVLFALLLAACTAVVPAGETPASSTAEAETAPATAANYSANVVYDLPDLEGRSVVAVTADDFTPFQYIDPQSGESVGYEYDLVDEICRRPARWIGRIARGMP